jgi:hypothetical protein
MRYALVLVIVIAALAGCSALGSQIVGNTPSFEYCSKVEYKRDGNKVTILAECMVPLGGTTVPLPVPSGL